MSFGLQLTQRPERPYAGGDESHTHFSEGRHANRRPAARENLRRCATPVNTRTEPAQSDTFPEMFQRSRARFVRMAYSILQNKEDAEDAVQDAMLSAYLHMRMFEGRSAFTTWFTRIVMNAALMLRRKRKSARVESLSDSGSVDDAPWVERMPAPHPNPETLFAQEEACDLVDALLAKLNPLLRQAFTLSYHREMSSSEAAATLGVSTATFKSRVLRARRLLMQHAQRCLAAPMRNRGRYSGSFSEIGKCHAAAATRSEVFSPEIAFS